MRKSRSTHVGLGVMGVVLAVLLAASLACAAAEPTATPAAPAPPAPPTAPTAAPAPTVAAAPAPPTPVTAVATPTRALPTPTQVVAGKPVYGGTLRYAGRMEDKTLDPHFVNQSGSYRPLYAMFNNIVQLAPDGSMAPDLAQSWTFSPDGKTINFNLQRGVKFHDGTNLNAQAVKANYDRILNPAEVSPRRGDIAANVLRIEAVDEFTVAMHLIKPLRPLLALLADRTGWVVSTAAVQKLGKDFGRNPVGTGPFILKEWVPDQQLLLRRNDSYWEKGKPYLDAILHQVVDRAEIQFAMLRTGETDVVETIRPEDIRLIEASANMKLSPPAPGRTEILNFNQSMAPFNNKALRQAVAYSIDREKAVKVAFGGAARPAYTLHGTGWAHNPDLKPIVYDPAKAKAKLVEAGYPNGITIPMGCRASQAELTECEIYQAMMKEVGISIDIKVIPAADYVGPEGFIKRVGFGTLRWSPRPDPHTVLFWLGHSKSRTNDFYRGGYYNPEVDRLLDEAEGIYDTAKAKLLYDRVQTILADDAIYTYIVWRTEWIALSKKVQNFAWTPDLFHRLRDLWLEK